MAYTVEKGDNLSKIAQALGVSLDVLIQMNPQIEDPNLIQPGQVINTSQEEAGSTPSTSGDAQISDDTDLVQGVEDQGGGVTTGPGQEDEDLPQEGVGGQSDSTVSILTSEDMRWFYDPDTGKWMVTYKLPNSNRRVVYEATGAQLDAIFGEGQRPLDYGVITFQDLVGRDNHTFGGSIAEVEGSGSYESHVERIITLALDEGKLPDWAQGNVAVHDLLYIAQAENKSDEWLIEQIAKLPVFQQRFPGIESLTSLGLTVSEAVTGFLEMEMAVKELTVRAGGSPDSIVPSTIGDLITQGHSIDDVKFTFRIFDTMEKNAGALDAFNEILAARGVTPLEADDMFDFLAGNAPQELYDIWEESSLFRAAQDAGLTIGASEAIDLAKRTEGLTSYDTALEGLSVAAQNILRFRADIDYDRFGIQESDLIDLSLGLAPSSGVNQAELARNMERAIMTAKASRERSRVNPFTQFAADGTPQQASLTNVRGEG